MPKTQKNSLLEKVLSNSTIKHADSLHDSVFFNEKDVSRTNIPALNVALSGEITGGLTSGLTQICGPSKHFKSNFGLIMVAAYLRKYPDAVCVFLDSEFGITNDMLKSAGVDPNRVAHVPIEHIEMLKFETVKQLNGLERGDKVIFFCDSVGNLASKKEVEDAEDQKSVADMTRAKALKSCFRIITPKLTVKDVPMVVINHVYQETGMFAKTVVSGGTGIYLSSDNIFIVGRAQEKEGTDVVGYDFKIRVEKSRYTKERSIIPVNVTWAKGVNPFSGLFDWALECGIISKGKQGFYKLTDLETGEVIEKSYRKKELDNNKDIWIPILKNKDFQNWVRDTFKSKSPVTDEDLNDEIADLFDD